MVEGSWSGGAEGGSATPRLTVRVADSTVGPPGRRTITGLALAEPYFAAEAGRDDLCSDDGSTSDEIRVRCIVGRGDVERVVVRKRSGALEVVEGDQPPRAWRLAGHDSTCLALQGLAGHRDLDTLRASWGRDTPSARCAGAASRPPTQVLLRFTSARSAERFPCRVGGPLEARGELVLPALGIHEDLGPIGNLCGAVNAVRYEDAEALTFRTSDVGVDARVVYRLGDRLYYLGKDDRIASLELPCGVKTVLAVSYPWPFGRQKGRLRSE